MQSIYDSFNDDRKVIMDNLKISNYFTFIYISLFSSSLYSMGTYKSGTGALEVFSKDAMLASPLWLKLWIITLVSSFLCGFFFIRQKSIARWAIGGLAFVLLTGQFIFYILNLPMLSGSISICHLVFWTPVFVMLLKKRPFLDQKESFWFRTWSAVLTCVILFSFIFDLRDAFIYVKHFSN